MKILYAAGNRQSSYELLRRFLETYRPFHQIKAAAYPVSVGNLFVDWNLEACLSKKEIICFENNNFELFFKEVRSFRPDLIISDLEPFASYTAIELGIPVYQVSPFLIHFGTKNIIKNYAKYSALFFPHSKNREINNFILNNSDKRLILSHLGDIENAPQLLDGFEFVRPSYREVLFPQKIITGDPMFLSDYYYNHLSHQVKTDYQDLSSIVASSYNIRYGLSNKEFDLHLNDNIPFLSSYLK